MSFFTMHQYLFLYGHIFFLPENLEVTSDLQKHLISGWPVLVAILILLVGPPLTMRHMIIGDIPNIIASSDSQIFKS